MAQVEQYKGKLGFEHRSEEKLTLALTELLDTLEEFGHPTLQINARDPHRIGLDCDHYKISLRLRRIPLRLGVRTPPGVPAPAAYIELALTPCFPDACDQEISEILLAMILKRLTEALDPLVIFWQETSKALTPKQFLGAFAPLEEPVAEAFFDSPAMVIKDEKAAIVAADTMLEQALADASPALSPPEPASLLEEFLSKERHVEKPVPSQEQSSAARPEPEMSAAAKRLWMADQARADAEAERARGQARFGSADEATPVLEQHCDEIQSQPRRIKPRSKIRRRPAGAAPHASYQTVFGKSRLGWLMALPRAVASMVTNSIRSVDLVLSVRALLTGMVILFLHGSGMVQAAAKVLLPH
ncbi:hypothetical protein [Pseudophaeobacter sp. EL27]|uniref:hypothetical protein n=1 Tax=Pseudophaeobacter sp. EL27 TaxID=2107580 RepID=UPI000EFD472E|nr:hypothetical protein [Pseudophaeobacter sp. EL27]